jgi:hypothetical protein
MRIYFTRPQLDLRPAPASSAVGSYEVYDCKLACKTKAATILQLSLYSELLERAKRARAIQTAAAH